MFDYNRLEMNEFYLLCRGASDLGAQTLILSRHETTLLHVLHDGSQVLGAAVLLYTVAPIERKVGYL